MISLNSGLRVYLATGVTDMRKSIDTLAIVVADRLVLDPLSGHLFAFCNRRRDTIKILYWDRNGFCLWMKRLEAERFAWPAATSEGMAQATHPLSLRELEVCRWAAEGKQTSDIAQILGITPRTVTFHLNNVVTKLGASSKCQAISWALKQGVVRLNVELAAVANVDEQ